MQIKTLTFLLGTNAPALAHLPESLHCWAAVKRVTGSTPEERIQSESPTLGADGQDLLHRVKSHGGWLVGKAMTDGLRQKVRKRWEASS